MYYKRSEQQNKTHVQIYDGLRNTKTFYNIQSKYIDI